MASPVSTARAAFFEAAEKRSGGGLVGGRPDPAIRDHKRGFGWKDQREPACQQDTRAARPLGTVYKPHSFRHGRAHYLDEQGVKVQDISRFLDHASVDHTMRYLQSMEDESGVLGNL